MRGDVKIDSETIEYLRGGGLVVAANARAARALERDFARAQLDRKAWSAAQTLTWDVWLGELWRQHLFNSAESRLLLSDVQERSVWTRIVGRDAQTQQVLSPDSLATLAQQAYALLCDYRAHTHRKHSWSLQSVEDSGRDAEAFRGWAAAFDRECRENNWISQSRLAEELTERIENATVTVTDEIRTLGFDRFTPAQLHLLDAVRKSGCAVKLCIPPVFENECELFAAKDRGNEIYACAQWLRSRLLADPQQRLAVIVPDAHGSRAELERVFRRVLMPSSMYLAGSQSVTVSVTEAEPPPAFEFSLGVPLASLPVVRAALLLLRWLEESLRQEEVTWLLLSGFLTLAEMDAAQLDARIRAKALLPPEIELAVFLKQGAHPRSAAADRLLQWLSRFYDAAAKAGIPRRKRPAMEWAEEAPKLLSAAGWPGPQQQSSLRFQALEKWEQLLISVATLSFDGSRMSYGEFLKALERQAVETIFAPRSLDAPVQIVGEFESSGQSFDGIWFMGAEEGNWPARSGPSPLIPTMNQRSAGMPHASVEADWELAKTATQRIRSSAPECVFSYARQNQDGDLRLSSLLRAVSKSVELERSSMMSENVTVVDAIEMIDESAPVPWLQEKIAGGAEVLTRQSACAFQAFAKQRLRARDIETLEWGLSARLRGELLHKVLERLWSGDDGLGSHAGLKAARLGYKLEPLLEQQIGGVFEEHAATRGAEGWVLAYLETEKLRLKKLLLLWLRQEEGRKPFEVENCELKIPDLRVGELRLNVRLDRIDRLTNGQKLLIDYKTAEVSAKMWDGPRPDEPQLPLYATFADLGEIGGLLFAQIRAGDMDFKGQLNNPRELLAISSKGRSGIEALTAADRDSWRGELLRLADDFLRGEAAVAPKNYPATCTHCGLQSLCRVAATDVPLEASDVDRPDENGGE